MAWDYSETLKDHFFNPRNILEVPEEEYRADGIGEVGNVKCGDMMKMYVQIDDSEHITDCKWKTYGCASAIGSTSLLSEMVKGMTIDEALKITPDDIAKALGGLPSQKFHCSVLGDKALRAAFEDYFTRKGTPERIHWKQKVIVCKCLNISRDEIEKLVDEGVRDFISLQEKTKLGTGCGECIEEAKKIFEELKKEHCSV
ncbi:MAG: iron-sulfur cluster assembly scaffold protein [Candidatus Eremiobacteraeota bacterium]|nr:iron-sulfur cluster assembly scaffold protein [Candidatus Eremiobacteraeota bacterium]